MAIARDLEPIRALHAAGKTHEALLACRELLARQPERADALAVCGTLALKLGDLSLAESSLRAAAHLDPNSPDLYFNLGNALVRMGRRTDAMGAFNRALALRPGWLEALNNLGKAQHECGDLAAAVATFERALAANPQAAHVHRNLGIALHGANRLADALICFKRAAALRPDWTKALQSVATAAAESGEWQTTERACSSWLTHSPGNVEALGLLSIALDELGESRAADELLDFERLLRCTEVSAAPGFASLSAFNAELTRQTLTHPSLHVPPANDPRYHCPTLRMTAELCVGSEGASAALATLVGHAIQGYVADLARSLPTHPFVAGAPRRFRLISWATVLDGEGNLEPHVHYSSYVSAVYYPKIPRAMDSAGHGAGYLEFGGGPARFPCRVKRAMRAIEPREGLLLLFPSYFYHRTAPFQAPEPRIAIAFDTVPDESS